MSRESQRKAFLKRLELERRRAEERAAAAARRGAQAIKKEPPKPASGGRAWLIRLAIPSLAYAAGLAVLGIQFGLGILIAALSAGWFFLDWWFVDSRGLGWPVRLFVSTFPAALLGLVGWLWFRPAPINLSFEVTPGPYATGTTVAGIKFTDKESDLRVYLSNDTDADYENLDVKISTNTAIVAGATEYDLGKCTFEVASVLANASVRLTLPNGKSFMAPVPLKGGYVAGPWIQVRCDKLARRSKIEVIVATANANPIQNSKQFRFSQEGLAPTEESGPPRGAEKERSAPKWITIQGSYVAFSRERDINKRLP